MLFMLNFKHQMWSNIVIIFFLIGKYNNNNNITSLVWLKINICAPHNIPDNVEEETQIWLLFPSQ